MREAGETAGYDSKKSKSNGEGKSRSFAVLRMTTSVGDACRIGWLGRGRGIRGRCWTGKLKHALT
jgi:hypothetical protein